MSQTKAPERMTKSSRKKRPICIRHNIGMEHDMEDVNLTGRLVSVCTCEQSKKFPFCDGTHKRFNEETNSNIQPLIIEVPIEKSRNRSQNQTTSKSGNLTSQTSGELKSNSSKDKMKRENSLKENGISGSDDSESDEFYEFEEDKDIEQRRPSTSDESEEEEVYNFCEEQDKANHLEEQEKQEQSTTLTQRKKTDDNNDLKEFSRRIYSIPLTLPNPPPFPKVCRKEIKAVYTVEEVAQHHSANDLWMIINGSVYNLTPYLKYHPGGHGSLLKFAGKDGSDNVQFHSHEMLRLLNTYFYIGKLAGANDSSCIIS